MKITFFTHDVIIHCRQQDSSFFSNLQPKDFPTPIGLFINNKFIFVAFCNLYCTPWSKKTRHPTIVHIFTICWPIFKSLSLENLAVLYIHNLSRQTTGHSKLPTTNVTHWTFDPWLMQFMTHGSRLTTFLFLIHNESHVKIIMSFLVYVNQTQV